MSRYTRSGAAVTRRAVVAGSGVLAASAALAACAGYGSQGAAPRQAPADSGDPGSGVDAAPTGQQLASTSDIPVGGGAVFDSEDVVVTQPEEGTFKAFSAICTHTGCTVNKVANGTIDCPCHGSKYAVEDGSVVNGPAQQALAERQITVSGDSIQLA